MISLAQNHHEPSILNLHKSVPPPVMVSIRSVHNYITILGSVTYGECYKYSKCIAGYVLQPNKTVTVLMMMKLMSLRGILLVGLGAVGMNIYDVYVVIQIFTYLLKRSDHNVNFQSILKDIQLNLLHIFRLFALHLEINLTVLKVLL